MQASKKQAGINRRKSQRTGECQKQPDNSKQTEKSNRTGQILKKLAGCERKAGKTGNKLGKYESTVNMRNFDYLAVRRLSGAGKYKVLWGW